MFQRLQTIIKDVKDGDRGGRGGKNKGYNDYD